MTEPTRPADHRAPRAGAHREEPTIAESIAGLCPYLASATGRWRALEPSRDHRCAAAAPGPIASETQRRHCLGPGHRACPVYVAATGGSPVEPRQGRRPLASTAPVVVERGGVSLPAGVRVERRTGGRIVAAIVVLAAVLAFALARGPLSGPGASPAPSASAAAVLPSATPAATPAPTPAPTVVPTATPVPTPVRTPRPTPTPVARTYRVQAGDTLSGIAKRFGTTTKILAELNGITNVRLLHTGQILKLP